MQNSRGKKTNFNLPFKLIAGQLDIHLLYIFRSQRTYDGIHQVLIWYLLAKLSNIRQLFNLKL